MKEAIAFFTRISIPVVQFIFDSNDSDEETSCHTINITYWCHPERKRRMTPI
ncbi:hypothetical protein SBF1_7420002 [Candidatus Desulfosporosinus infrequens]|uniref:Uncharacterized protein n=1 Tax=Candidatus Desulfosporosinus infrequens TaxID=2043169 RepID=A0A2U3LR20_9FIRM|nr:hypothetical protein SBF1_7420002 [Candidatus Desulfosporosinus infrequens]